MSRLEFYEKHYQSLFEPLSALMKTGVRIDVREANRHRASLRKECTRIQSSLEDLAGEPLHAKKDFSNPKIQAFLYGTLGFPRLYKEGRVTADEGAIRKCMNRAQAVIEGKIEKSKGKYFHQEPKEAMEACRLLLRHREAAQERKLLTANAVDPDGRLRCRYVFGPYTGRLASRKNPYGTGVNLQNPSRKMRRIFIPDKGCLFLECDLSQAESREVYMQTGDPYLRELAQAKPWEHDDHSRTAGMIFLDEEIPKGFIARGSLPITPDQRQFGKKTRHAYHYDEHGARMSEDLLKESESTIIMSPAECEGWLVKLNEKEPGIGLWKAAIRKALFRDPTLRSSWGREVDVSNLRYDDALFRIGYAFHGQSPVGDLLNVQGLVPLFNHIKREGLRSRINLQVHDALIISCPPDEIWAVAKYLRDELEKPHQVYSPVTRKTYQLSIPCEFFVGTSWSKKDGKSWDRLPKRSELREFAEERIREAA